MKTLFLAMLFFGVVIYGCYDVLPWRPLKREVRRTPRKRSAPAPEVEYQPPPVETPPMRRGRRY